MDRDAKVRWIRKNLIPWIDTEFKHSFSSDPDEEHVREAEEVLAEEYLDEGRGIFKSFLKVIAPLVILDVLFPMPAQVYGLVISMVGTWFLLVEVDILGSRGIADQSEYSTGATYGGTTALDRGKVKRLARNTVMANIGLIWLTGGFLLQIVAVSLDPNVNLIATDFLG